MRKRDAEIEIGRKGVYSVGGTVLPSCVGIILMGDIHFHLLVWACLGAICGASQVNDYVCVCVLGGHPFTTGDGGIMTGSQGPRDPRI